MFGDLRVIPRPTAGRRHLQDELVVVLLHSKSFFRVPARMWRTGMSFPLPPLLSGKGAVYVVATSCCH